MDQTKLSSWPRERFVAGNGDATLYYRVYGNLDLSRPLSQIQYRCAGVPQGLELRRIDRTSPAFEEVLGEPMSKVLRQTFAQLDEEHEASQNAVLMLGTFQDPPTLDYFRDTIGLITWMLDSGGRFVYDPQQLRCWSAEAWRKQVFDLARPAPLLHCVVLVSEDDDGTRWYHTRGLRQYGRPDVSIRHVPEQFWAGAEEVCKRFIEYLAQGAVAEDGCEVRVRGFPRCAVRHAGGLEDPDFNNRHIEIDLVEDGQIAEGNGTCR